MYVDDDASFLKTSKKILELDNNFSVDTATSVDEAFCKLKTQHYNAIVSDYEMPQKNVLDFLKELRETKNFRILTDAFSCFSLLCISPGIEE